MMATPVVSLAAEADSDDSSNIVVTGSKISASTQRLARKRAARGDWNACTMDDPGRDLGRCKKLIDPAAPGPAGRAAAYLADGLSQAWRDELDGAVTAFGQAIQVSPRLSFAYLNRGLAYQRLGDLTRALADLDLAVRYAPNTARNHYHRSLVLRQNGDVKRARADEDRAIELDSRYEAVIAP